MTNNQSTLTYYEYNESVEKEKKEKQEKLKDAECV